MMDYFYNKTTGINADIARHREKEAFLNEEIARLKGSTNPMDVSLLSAYRNLLSKLMESKANTVSKIGR
jgi:hypothetical protein